MAQTKHRQLKQALGETLEARGHSGAALDAALIEALAEAAERVLTPPRKPRPDAGQAKPDLYSRAAAMAEVCGMQFGPNRQRLFKRVAQLPFEEATPEEIRLR